MAQKDNKTIIIIIGAIIVLAFFFFKGGVDIGVQDQGVNLKVYAYDSNKELIGEVRKGGNLVGELQATVQFPGGDPEYGVQYIKIQSTISHTQGVPITLTNIIGSPSEYSTAIAAYSKSFSLSSGQSNIQVSDFIDIEAMGIGAHTFRLDINSFYRDAQGNQISLSPYGTIIISVISDVCSDGTPEGQCSSTQPLYCDGGILVNKATVCGCELGWEIIGETCNHLQCGVTYADNCIAATLGTYNPQYCDINGNTIEGCGSDLCGVASVACADDYYNNPPLGCTEGDTCEYDVYSGDLSVGLGGEGEVGTTYVIFRTTSDMYGSGADIAYTDNCGNALTSYGTSVGDLSLRSGTCGIPYPSGLSSLTYIMDIPSSLLPGGNPGRLYISGTYLYVCDDDGTNRIQWIYGVGAGTSTDPEAGATAYEVTC